MSTTQPGPVIAIGGEVKDELLRYVAQAANMESPRIVALTAASAIPVKKGESYGDRFRALGFPNYTAIHAPSRDEANDPRLQEEIELADVFFVLGGCQTRFMRAAANTLMLTEILKRHEQGAVFAGTSAGAAIMADLMPTGGDSRKALRMGTIPFADGLRFIQNSTIDMHLDHDPDTGESRLPRLFNLYACRPGNVGIGIDENTAVVVRGSLLNVVGAGHVAIVDQCAVDLTNGHSLKPGDMIDPQWFKPHVFSEGGRYDLEHRQVLSLS